MEFFFYVSISFCGLVSRVVGGDPEPYFAVGWGIAKQRLRGLYPVRNFLLELFSKFFCPEILCPPF